MGQISVGVDIRSLLLKTFVIAALALTAWVLLTGLNIVNDEYDPRSLLKKAASPPEASIDDIIGDGDGAIAAPARAWSNWDAGVRSVC